MDQIRQPAQPLPLTDAQIAAALNEAAATQPGVAPLPETQAMSTLRLAISSLRDPAIEPAPEQLLRRLVALPTKVRMSQALDRAADAVTAAVHAVARTIIASLTFDSRSTPALAGFRGSAGATQLEFTCDLGEIHIHATESAQSSDGRLTVRGVFQPTDALNSPPHEPPATFTLTPASSRPATAFPITTTVDEDSMFVLHIAPGPYHATLRAAGTEIDLGVLELP